MASAAGLVVAVVTSPVAAEDRSSRPMGVEDLAALQDIAGLSLSPDGGWAVFQQRQGQPARNRYESAWYAVSTRNGAALRIAEAGDPILTTVQGRIGGAIHVEPAAWSPDGEWVAFLRKSADVVQVWRSRRDGGSVERLTNNESEPRAVAYSRDGRRLYLEVRPSRRQIDDALAGEGLGGFLYDRRFFPSYDRRPVLPPDAVMEGEARLFAASEVAARRVWVYDFGAGIERLATDDERAEFGSLTAPPRPQNRRLFRGAVAVSPRGALAWTEAVDPHRQGGIAPLTIFAQIGGSDAPVQCRAAECTGQQMLGIWWRNEKEVIFARGEGVRSQDTALYAWNPNESAPRLILRTGDKLIAPLESCRLADDRLICFYEQPDAPRRLVAVRLSTGRIDTLYDPNPQFSRFKSAASVARVRIRGDGAAQTYGYLVLPASRAVGERLSLVIVTYRCSGFLRGGTGDEYPVYPLVAQGMAVLCFAVPDIDSERLAVMDWESYQRESRGPGDPEKRRVQQALDAAVAQLDAAGYIDPARVAVTGLSFGAETVSYALFNMKRLTVAIASGAEMGPASAFLYGPGGRHSLAMRGLGTPDSERWLSLSLSRNAHRVRAPLLLNVADREMLDPLEAVAALEHAGRAVEMYVFPEEYHAKWQPAHRLAIYRRNIDWLNFWLRGVEDSAPAKVGQYERWRVMRENQCRLFDDTGAPWYCRQRSVK